MNLDIKAILLKVFNLIWGMVMEMLGYAKEEAPEEEAPEANA